MVGFSLEIVSEEELRDIQMKVLKRQELHNRDVQVIDALISREILK